MGGGGSMSSVSVIYSLNIFFSRLLSFVFSVLNQQNFLYDIIWVFFIWPLCPSHPFISVPSSSISRCPWWWCWWWWHWWWCRSLWVSNIECQTSVGSMHCVSFRACWIFLTSDGGVGIGGGRVKVVAVVMVPDWGWLIEINTRGRRDGWIDYCMTRGGIGSEWQTNYDGETDRERLWETRKIEKKEIGMGKGVRNGVERKMGGRIGWGRRRGDLKGFT